MHNFSFCWEHDDDGNRDKSVDVYLYDFYISYGWKVVIYIVETSHLLYVVIVSIYHMNRVYFNKIQKYVILVR